MRLTSQDTHLPTQEFQKRRSVDNVWVRKRCHGGPDHGTRPRTNEKKNRPHARWVFRITPNSYSETAPLRKYIKELDCFGCVPWTSKKRTKREFPRSWGHTEQIGCRHSEFTRVYDIWNNPLSNLIRAFILPFRKWQVTIEKGSFCFFFYTTSQWTDFKNHWRRFT